MVIIGTFDDDVPTTVSPIEFERARGAATASRSCGLLKLIVTRFVLIGLFAASTKVFAIGIVLRSIFPLFIVVIGNDDLRAHGCRWRRCSSWFFCSAKV